MHADNNIKDYKHNKQNLTNGIREEEHSTNFPGFDPVFLYICNKCNRIANSKHISNCTQTLSNGYSSSQAIVVAQKKTPEKFRHDSVSWPKNSGGRKNGFVEPTDSALLPPKVLASSLLGGSGPGDITNAETPTIYQETKSSSDIESSQPTKKIKVEEVQDKNKNQFKIYLNDNCTQAEVSLVTNEERTIEVQLSSNKDAIEIDKEVCEEQCWPEILQLEKKSDKIDNKAKSILEKIKLYKESQSKVYKDERNPTTSRLTTLFSNTGVSTNFSSIKICPINFNSLTPFLNKSPQVSCLNTDKSSIEKRIPSETNSKNNSIEDVYDKFETDILKVVNKDRISLVPSSRKSPQATNKTSHNKVSGVFGTGPGPPKEFSNISSSAKSAQDTFPNSSFTSTSFQLSRSSSSSLSSYPSEPENLLNRNRRRESSKKRESEGMRKTKSGATKYPDKPR